MGMLFVSTSFEIILTLLLALWCIYSYLTKNYNFWKKRGIPYRVPVFPFGSMKDLALGKVQIGKAYEAVYKEFPEHRLCGVIELCNPMLVIRDPELIKQVMITDFDHFVDRVPVEIYLKEEIDQNLFMVNGDLWRDMRYKLSPAFSSSKMKYMFLIMIKCGERLQESLHCTTKTSIFVDVKDILTKYTTDSTATSAFGLEIKPLMSELKEDFRSGISVFKSFPLVHQWILALFPALAQILNVGLVDKKQKVKLHYIVSNLVNYREENNIHRNDILDTLIKLKQYQYSISDGRLKKKDVLYVADAKDTALDLITAQIIIFFIAGFETSSSIISFCLYELAQNSVVQEKILQEYKEILARHGDQLTYEAVQEMTYMDNVIDETLRLYPTLPVIHRRCTKTYKVPGSELVLQKGQRICIPVYAIQRDPKYYPDPDKFDPDRFNQENINSRPLCTYLPVGTGPRNCIGRRFGRMQVKVGLAMFLLACRVDMTPDTPVPIEFYPLSFNIQPDKPIILKVSRR